MAPDGSPGLSLRLFGFPSLTREGSEVPLTPLQLALLCVVVCSEARGGTPRPKVLTLLWEGGSESALRRRLRQVLHTIRSRIGADPFERMGDVVRVRRAFVVPESDLLERWLAEHEFDRAAELVARGFLTGLPDHSTRAFGHWVDQKHASYRAAVLERAAREWTTGEAEGLWNQRTLRAARALAILNPFDEDRLRHLMWAQAMSGATEEALAAFDAFVGRRRAADLDQERWQPSEETTLLRERVRALARQRKSRSPRPTGRLPIPTMYGREAEVARLRPVLSGERVAGLRTVVIEGEAGLGKTRLANECLKAAHLQGRLVLRARLAELEKDIPLNALIEALSTQEVAAALDRLEEPWRSVILTLIPEFSDVVGPAEPLPYVHPESLQRRLLESLRLLFDQIAADHPVVLYLDDFHWVDDSSLAALEYMRRRWSEGSAVLVVAARPEVVQPGSKLASFLEGEGGSETLRLSLADLDEASQQQLVAEIADEPVSSADFRRIQALGRGNPLFLIELTRQWSSGGLDLPEQSTDPIALPVSIQQLFERKVATLSDHGLRVLEACSVLGQPATLNRVSRVSQLQPRAVAEALDVLEGAAMVTWTDQGVDLWHGLVRQAVLGRVTNSRRRWLHGQVAHLLIEEEEGALDQIALHCDRAGMRAEAYRHALRAAEEAEAVGATPEAIRFLSMARGNARSPDEAGSVTVRLAELNHLQCRFRASAPLLGQAALYLNKTGHRKSALLAKARKAEAEAHLEAKPLSKILAELAELERVARGDGDWVTIAKVLDVQIHIHFRRGNVEHVRRLLPRLADCMGCGAPLASSIALSLGTFDIYVGDARRGARHCQRALDVAQGVVEADDLQRVVCAWLTSRMLRGALFVNDTLVRWKEAIRATYASGDLRLRMRLTCNLAAAFIDAGEAHLALPLLNDAGDILGSAAVEPHRFQLWANLGDAHLESNDPLAARELYLKALDTPSLASSLGHLSVAAHAALGRAALQVGDLPTARRCRDTVMGSADQVFLPADVTHVALFEAELLRSAKDVGGACSVVRGHRRRVKGRHVPFYLKLLLAEARLCSNADPARALRLCARGSGMARRLGYRTRLREFLDVRQRVVR